jgi:lysophospholipase L1-like esterase
VYPVGRYQGPGETPTFSWSGTGFVVKFSGPGLSARLRDSADVWHTVSIDGVAAPLATSAGEASYVLAGDLDPGEHTVAVYRRTEASFGPTELVQLELEEGSTLLSVPAPSRRIEFVGDSITCGYGNGGTEPTCPFSSATENHLASYGAIAARLLGAEGWGVAWSGKGVSQNYGGNTTDPLPALYERAIPTDPASVWDFSTKPDAVVINLGTNDFSSDPDPTQETFAADYEALLETIRTHYPEAFVLCTVGPMLSGTDLEKARTGIETAVEARQTAGDANVAVFEMNVANDSPGCDYHPSVATHELMAEVLAVELRAHLGW